MCSAAAFVQRSLIDTGSRDFANHDLHTHAVAGALAEDFACNLGREKQLNKRQGRPRNWNTQSILAGGYWSPSMLRDCRAGGSCSGHS